MFELNKQCNIEHLNVRRGKNDESEVAIDIKFKAEDVPAAALVTALRANDVEEVIAAFWRTDEEQSKRFLGIGAIPIDQEWEGKHMIKISSLSKMRVVKLAKMSLTMRAHGMFDVLFRVTVEQPKENYIENIAEKIHKSVNVKLEQDNRELDLKPPKEEAADKKPGKVKRKEPQQQTLQ